MADQNPPNVAFTNSTAVSTGNTFEETGFGAPGSTVSVYDFFNGVDYAVGTTTVAADGTWSVGSSFASGNNELFAVDTKSNGQYTISNSETIYQTANSSIYGPTVQFDSEVQFKKPFGKNAATNAVLTLAVSGQNAITGVELYSDGQDIGAATQNVSTGKWSYTFKKPAGDYNDIQAVAIDVLGHESALTNSNIELVTGGSGQSSYVYASDGSSASQSAFSKSGTLLYAESYTTLADGNTAGLITGNTIKEQYFYDGNEKDTITNFHAKGANHDTLNLQGLGFGSVQDVLNHSNNIGGNLAIHIGSNEVILDGVNKSSLQMNHHDILV